MSPDDTVDEWVSEPLWKKAVTCLDHELTDDLSNIAELSRRIPLQVFGQILLDPRRWLPTSGHLLPSMPTDEIQIQWTGNCGEVLLAQSVDFIHAALGAAAVAGLDVQRSQVLDFGIGWGRLARLWLKYGPPDQLKGCDAWTTSLDIARNCGIPNTLVQSDPLLESLPFATSSFDICWAFSVFTHLSPRAFVSVLSGIARMLRSSGIFVFTVRPESYWNLDGPREMLAQTMQDPSTANLVYDSEGLRFLQHVPENPDFGDTSVTVPFLEEASRSAGFEITAMEWSLRDPYQILVVAERR